MRLPPAGSVMHFSTDGMSEREAISYWRDTFGRAIVKLDYRPVNHHPFRQVCRLQALPGLKIAFGATNGLSAHRTKALIADGSDDFVFSTNLAGQCTVSQRGRELDVHTGQASLVSSVDVASNIFPGPANFLTLAIPRKALAQRMGNPEGALLRLVPADNGALRLLADYVAMAMDKHAPLAADLQPLFVNHVHDLVALAMGATRDGAVLAQGRGMRAARLTAMKADILAHLREEGLSVHDIARRHGVTPRYVQMLFDADGMTFSEFVVEQRLAKARGMLVNPQFLGWTISAIAYEVGFSNLSYFNRTFLRRYNATPSDIRNAALRGK